MTMDESSWTVANCDGERRRANWRQDYRGHAHKVAIEHVIDELEEQLVEEEQRTRADLGADYIV